MATGARPNVTPQLVLGVFLLLFGTILLLDQLDIVQTGQLRPFWPTALIAVGTAMLVRRQDPSGRFWGMAWTGIGGWMLLNRLGWLDISLWQLIGPMVLIFIGVNVMLQTMRRTETTPSDPSRPLSTGSAARLENRITQRAAPAGSEPGITELTEAAMPLPSEPPPLPPPIPEATRAPQIPLQSDPTGGVTLLAVLGEAKRASNDNPFRGGEMTAFMGGCVLDLRQATVRPGEKAVINVLAVMGGHEIRVPHGWAVASDIVPILGGVDDKRLPPAESVPANAPLLRLRGLVLMGGLVIKN